MKPWQTITAVVEHGILQPVDRGPAAAVVFHMLWQVLYKPPSNSGRIVYKPVLTLDKSYTTVDPTTAPCSHCHVSVLDATDPEI